MIVDSIENANMYLGLNENLDMAIRFILETDFYSEGALKEYTIDGENVYAFVNESELREALEAKPEVHNRYGDIHFVLEGEEIMGWERRDKLICGEFNDKDDYALLEGEVIMVRLAKGSFIIVFPQDAHMPSIATSKCKKVKKVVVKFKI